MRSTSTLLISAVMISRQAFSRGGECTQNARVDRGKGDAPAQCRHQRAHERDYQPVAVRPGKAQRAQEVFHRVGFLSTSAGAAAVVGPVFYVPRQGAASRRNGARNKRAPRRANGRCTTGRRNPARRVDAYSPSFALQFDAESGMLSREIVKTGAALNRERFMNRDMICTWLGLADKRWPPDPYALLGLAPGDCDGPSIEKRVQERMAKLRCYQLSHPEEATEGMNRVAQAFIALIEKHGPRPESAPRHRQLPPPRRAVDPSRQAHAQAAGPGGYGHLPSYQARLAGWSTAGALHQASAAARRPRRRGRAARHAPRGFCRATGFALPRPRNRSSAAWPRNPTMPVPACSLCARSSPVPT